MYAQNDLKNLGEKLTGKTEQEIRQVLGEPDEVFTRKRPRLSIKQFKAMVSQRIAMDKAKGIDATRWEKLKAQKRKNTIRRILL